MKINSVASAPSGYKYYTADTKLPLKLGIVDSNSLKSIRYVNKNGTKTIDFYPAILDIATSSLSNNFASVETVAQGSQDENYDILALIKADIVRITKAVGTSEDPGMRGIVSVDFVDRSSKIVFSTKNEFQFYFNETNFQGGPANLLILATAGIAAQPMYQAAGNSIAEFASTKLADTFSRISRQIDSGLSSYAQTGAAHEKVVRPPSEKQTQPVPSENVYAERQRVKAEKARIEAEKKQLAAESERQRLEEEKAQLERQKAELAELRKKPKQTPLRPQIGGFIERRTALVIGNSAYQRGPLKNPANDARDMAAALKHLGFDVTTLTDATQPQMENAVRDFGTKLRQGGVGLFYYAGHGVQVSGENYLVPVNAVIQSEGDVKYGSVNAGLVLAKMEDAGNGLNIVILDACRSNPYARSFRTANEGLAKMDAPTGSLISYSTAPGSVASDGSGRNGVFTRHLLENMKEPGLPISEVLMRVRQGVVRETAKKQVPWEASSLIGQFYFVE